MMIALLLAALAAAPARAKPPDVRAFETLLAAQTKVEDFNDAANRAAKKLGNRLLLAVSPQLQPSQQTFTQDKTQASRRDLGAKLSDIFSAKDAPFLATGDGTTNDAAAINGALAARMGVVYLPASTSCYNTGATTLNMRTGTTLQGEGYGSPGNGAACITYTGTGCAVLFESVHNAALLNLDIHVNSASGSAAAVCFASGTANAEFNRVENVSVTADQVRVAGQVGLLLNDTSHGIFWNTFRMLRFKSWDTSLFMSATGTTQGVNSNQFYDLMSYAHNTAYLLRAGSKQVTDNRLYGLTCSRSDATQLGTTHCLMMGDDNVANVFGNSVYGLDNDSGSPDVCGVLGINSGANFVDATCASGGGFQDNGVGAFANAVFNHQGLGSTVNLFSVGNLTTTRGATITGTTFIGPTGAAGSSGGVVQIVGGQGSTSQPGGALQLLGGNAGAGNANAGSVLLSPGGPSGVGSAGAAVIGPTSGGGTGSGTRIRSSRVVVDSKPFTEIDCAGSNLGPTISQFLDASTFTCGTTQSITTNTAAIIVANLPGSGLFTNGAVAVGDRFDLVTVVATGAANFTLAAGSGVTIKGNAVANNSTLVVRCRVTNISSGTEAVTCIPSGGGVSVATANTWTATQNFTPSTSGTSAITATGTGAASTVTVTGSGSGILSPAITAAGAGPTGRAIVASGAAATGGLGGGDAIFATGGAASGSAGAGGNTLKGGAGTGTQSNGTALVVQSGTGGSGTSSGAGLQVLQSNSIKEHVLLSANSTDPSTPSIGGVWDTEDGTNATALKFRSSGAGGVSPATYILAPLVANSVSFTTSTTVTLPSNNMTCVCGIKSGGTTVTCDVSGTTLTLAQTGTHSVPYLCHMTQ